MVRQKTEVLLFIDETGSMGPWRKQAKEAFERKLEEYQAQSYDQDISVSIIPIRERYTKYHLYRTPANKIGRLPSYVPNAPRTAIIDCVGSVLDEFEYIDDDPNIAYLVCVITDGGENVSHYYDRIKNQVKRLIATDRWTFAFAVPENYKAKIIRDFGVPEGCVMSWDTSSDEGYREMGTMNVNSTQSYFRDRARGLRYTKSFYEVNVDREVEADLNQLPVFRGFQEYMIPHARLPIKELFQELGIAFKQGRLFYELSKPEEVQPSKNMIVMHRFDRTRVHHGQAARQALKLPLQRHIKVSPGVYGEWRIFVQSTSNNRKLEKGTSVLIV